MGIVSHLNQIIKSFVKLLLSMGGFALIACVNIVALVAHAEIARNGLQTVQYDSPLLRESPLHVLLDAISLSELGDISVATATAFIMTLLLEALVAVFIALLLNAYTLFEERSHWSQSSLDGAANEVKTRTTMLMHLAMRALPLVLIIGIFFYFDIALSTANRLASLTGSGSASSVLDHSLIDSATETLTVTIWLPILLVVLTVLVAKLLVSRLARAYDTLVAAFELAVTAAWAWATKQDQGAVPNVAPASAATSAMPAKPNVPELDPSPHGAPEKRDDAPSEAPGQQSQAFHADEQAVAVIGAATPTRITRTEALRDTDKYWISRSGEVWLRAAREELQLPTT